MRSLEQAARELLERYDAGEISRVNSGYEVLEAWGALRSALAAHEAGAPSQEPLAWAVFVSNRPDAPIYFHAMRSGANDYAGLCRVDDPNRTYVVQPLYTNPTPAPMGERERAVVEAAIERVRAQRAFVVLEVKTPVGLDAASEAYENAIDEFDIAVDALAAHRAGRPADTPAPLGEQERALLRKDAPEHLYSALAIKIVETLRPTMPEDWDDNEDIACAYADVDLLLREAVATALAAPPRTAHQPISKEAPDA